MIYTLTLNPAVDRELTVPQLVSNVVLRAEQWRVDAGGKGFNVARMLRQLGTDNVALGFVGGESGQYLRRQLELLGIGTDFVTVAEDTRTNVSIVSAATGDHIKVNEPGPTISAAEQEQLYRQCVALATAGDWWVVAGSLPPGVNGAFYVRLMQAIQATGAHVIFDSSGAALAAGIGACPYLIKPNDIELGQLTARTPTTSADLVAAAQQLIKQGVGHVVVSMGANGALLVDKSTALVYTAPDIDAKNPIGAGDAMVGGIVHGLAQGLPLAEAVRVGIACGSAATAKPGTQMPSTAEVDRLLAETPQPTRTQPVLGG